MNYNLNKNSAFVFNGVDGEETLFTEPFFDRLKATLGELFELPPLFRNSERAGDERSLAIITALIIENRVDEILKVIMPGYKPLAKNKDFTLSLKIGLVSAMHLFPKHIIASAEVVRQIRNDFAHNLEKETFDHVEQKYLARLSQLFLGIYGKEEADKKSTHEKFRGIAYIAVTGLHLYKRNIEVLRHVVTSEEFTESLKARVYEDFCNQSREIAEGDVMENIEDGMKVTRRAGIIVGIARLNIDGN